MDFGLKMACIIGILIKLNNWMTIVSQDNSYKVVDIYNVDKDNNFVWIKSIRNLNVR